MHPPGWVCKALHRLHPQLRLAWSGPDESFAIVQLYHVSDCGDIDYPTTFREFWNVTTREVDGIPQRVRADRGPIFNKNGGSTRDWDPCFRIPIFVMTLNGQYCYPDSEPINGPRDVYTGKFLTAIEHWCTSIKKRILESRRKVAREAISKANDIGEQITDGLWHEAQKPEETKTHVAYKHAKSDAKRFDHEAQIADRKLEQAFDVE